MTIKSKTGDELALRRPGAPAGNSNAVKSGFYSHSTKDLKLRARRTRRHTIPAIVWAIQFGKLFVSK